MTIAHILNFFYPYASAGTENYVLQLCKELQLNGHKAIVVIPGYDDDKEYLYNEIEVKKYKEDKRATKNAFLGLEPTTGVNNLKNLLIDLRPDIIHFHELGNGNGISFYHFHAAYSLKAKIFFTPHLATLTCSNSKMFFKSIEPCNGKIDLWKCTLCCASEKMNHKLTQNLFTTLSIGSYKLLGMKIPQISIIPHRIMQKIKELQIMEKNINAFCVISPWFHKVLLANNISASKIHLIKQASPSLAIDKSKPDFINTNTLRLIFVGRITVEKGLHLLLDALSVINFSFHLTIVGKVIDENYYNSCMQKTKSFAESVEWLGVKPAKEVLELMKMHHAVVLPSFFSEMSPLVIQEAFSLNIPVIASNAPGNADQIIDKKNGLLFRFNDSNDLRAKIVFFNNNFHLFKESSFDKSKRTFKDVYEELIQVYEAY